jgi:hypothetical protein
LLNLGHAKVVFRLIVGEGDVIFNREPQHIVLKMAKPLQEVTCFGASQTPPTAVSLTFVGRRAFFFGLSEEVAVAFTVSIGLRSLTPCRPEFCNINRL